MLRPEKGRVEQDEYTLMDAVEDRMWWYRTLHRHAVAALAALPEEGAVLDAGCGTGGFLARLRAAKPRARLYGLDYEPGAARRAAASSISATITASLADLPTVTSPNWRSIITRGAVSRIVTDWVDLADSSAK